MRIWDAFLFSNEWDCLDIRLHELEGIVHRHVLVEAETTFQGNPKPARFHDRAGHGHWPITAFKIDIKGSASTWDREAAQRNALLRALEEAGAADEDWALTSDADEIPSGQVLKEMAAGGELPFPQTSFEQRLYFYYVNNRCTTQVWHGTQLTTVAELRERRPQGARDCRNSAPTVYGGWHFCNLGDVDFMIEKLESFSHDELNTPEYKDRDFLTKLIAERRVIDGRRDMPFSLDEDDLPKWVASERRDLFCD